MSFDYRLQKKKKVYQNIKSDKKLMLCTKRAEKSRAKCAAADWFHSGPPELSQTSKFPLCNLICSTQPREAPPNQPNRSNAMFSSARGRIASVAISASRSSARVSSRASYSITTPRWSDNASIPANDPTPKKPVPNVSATNAVPVDSMGAFDGRLVEKPAEGEQNRQLQAPNRASTWAQSQKPREEAMTGPRFEQTIIELQVSAVDRPD